MDQKDEERRIERSQDPRDFWGGATRNESSDPPCHRCVLNRNESDPPCHRCGGSPFFVGHARDIEEERPEKRPISRKVQPCPLGNHEFFTFPLIYYKYQTEIFAWQTPAARRSIQRKQEGVLGKCYRCWILRFSPFLALAGVPPISSDATKAKQRRRDRGAPRDERAAGPKHFSQRKLVADAHQSSTGNPFPPTWNAQTDLRSGHCAN